MKPAEKSMFTKEEILTEWEATWVQVSDLVKGLSQEEFTRVPQEKWSIAQQLEHLTLSAAPVAQGINAPRMVLRTFGKPNRPSRDYEGLVQRYYERLNQGGTAPSGFVAKSDQTFDQEKMLEKWEKACKSLSKGIGKWDDEKLDKFLMPHPLLGKVLVREMLFFTVFHTNFHLVRIRETLEGKYG